MPERTGVLAKPEDWLWPAFHPDDCVLDEDGWLGQVTSATRPRGNVIAAAARELGVRFQDIRCTVNYIRPLTRQDAWDDYGEDNAVWDWADNHEPPLHYRDGNWLDAEGRIHQCPVPDRVPDDWDHGDPFAVWTYAKPDEPNAVKVYVCEERT